MINFVQKIKFFTIFLIVFYLSTNVSFAFTSKAEKMFGQKIMLGLGKDSNFNKVLKYAKKGKIGGIILFERDIKSRLDLLEKTSKIKNLKGIPLFIAVDQEGGYVQRMSARNGFKDYKSAKEISNVNPHNAYIQYKLMATELHFYGINLNFMPCVDLIIDENSILNKNERAYSSDPDVVSRYAKEAIKAHNENKVITSLKHFPGHGSISGDTHKGFVDVSETWSEIELEPFKKLANLNNLQTVMMAHVFNKNIDENYPASLSKKTTSILREFFDGVIVTDDLDMKAIKDNYNLQDVIVNAINADVDILLFSNYEEDVDLDRIYEIYNNALKNGTIKKEQVEKSFNRIIELKKALY